ncbi:MAG: succinate dehydrogenase/fumarate reductase iron-sulfur subunit [Candidatus Heimdallarchaeota archaeon]|nr:succinate dehydrogenase/fumarate reductase iron-sulfur subunit [Candidatus Heimdallarchaeota archaeon]
MKEKTFVIFRQKNPNAKPTYDRFKVPLTSGMTVLEALFYIQDHFDHELAFRYSCRGAICASCGLTINKFPQLACKTQVHPSEIKKHSRVPNLEFGDLKDWAQEKEILIEPLPNMPIVKDLVVDMEPFWKFYREVQPYFDREITDEAPESTQTFEDARRIEQLVYCILCGMCWTCPVSGKRKDYLGPSNLAKAFRFIDDTRVSDKHRKEIYEKAMQENGVPACEKIFACNAVCPKGVMPGTAIDKIRKLEKE